MLGTAALFRRLIVHTRGVLLENEFFVLLLLLQRFFEVLQTLELRRTNARIIGYLFSPRAIRFRCPKPISCFGWRVIRWHQNQSARSEMTMEKATQRKQVLACFHTICLVVPYASSCVLQRTKPCTSMPILLLFLYLLVRLLKQKPVRSTRKRMGSRLLELVDCVSLPPDCESCALWSAPSALEKASVSRAPPRMLFGLCAQKLLVGVLVQPSLPLTTALKHCPSPPLSCDRWSTRPLTMIFVPTA